MTPMLFRRRCFVLVNDFGGESCAQMASFAPRVLFVVTCQALKNTHCLRKGIQMQCIVKIYLFTNLFIYKCQLYTVLSTYYVKKN